MTTSTAPSRADRPLLVPPEERFWQRYSPHHEFPLSSAASVTLMTLAFVLVWVAVRVVPTMWDSSNGMITCDTIEIETGGGGENEPGVNAPGAPEPKEAIPPREIPFPKDIPTVQPLSEPSSPKSPVLLGEPDEGPSLPDYDKVAKELETIRRGINGPSKNPDRGNPGPAHPPGGKGPGGPGHGGDGRIGPMPREQRWVLLFETRNGADYLRQLAALGAILAVPEGEGQYRVYRNLKDRPIKGEIEDVRQIDRIFWIDNRPESVKSLASGMGLPAVPNHIAAFFSRELEAEMLAKELKYQQKPEDQIKGKTRFQPVWKGDRFEIVVVPNR